MHESGTRMLGLRDFLTSFVHMVKMLPAEQCICGTQGVMAKEAGTTQLQAPPTPSSLQPAAPVFTPEQLQENFEAAQAMMRCSSAILAEGVQRMRREAAKVRGIEGRLFVNTMSCCGQTQQWTLLQKACT